MKTHAIIVEKPGEPEVMKFGEIETGEPGPGEVLLRHAAIGLNFIDVYHRSGLYPVPSLPFTPGIEAAGEIIKVGPGAGFKPGQRVAYAFPPPGAYSEMRVMSAKHLVLLPDYISYELAASIMLKGLTAEYLLCRAYMVRKGQTILVHAAAGGVGQILCQWAKHLGAQVIGTVGNAEKAEAARACGCDYPVIYTQEDFKDKVMEYTEGKGVPVVYDSVGRDTFEKSLECLEPRGLMVSFGQSSGPIPPVDISVLSARGSLYLTRPSIMHYTNDSRELYKASEKLFFMLMSGNVKVSINKTYSLKEAAQSHLDLQNRKTTGSNLLIP